MSAQKLELSEEQQRIVEQNLRRYTPPLPRTQPKLQPPKQVENPKPAEDQKSTEEDQVLTPKELAQIAYERLKSEMAEHFDKLYEKKKTLVTFFFFILAYTNKPKN